MIKTLRYQRLIPDGLEFLVPVKYARVKIVFESFKTVHSVFHSF